MAGTETNGASLLTKYLWLSCSLLSIARRSITDTEIRRAKGVRIREDRGERGAESSDSGRKRKQAGPKEDVRERREVGRRLVRAVKCEEKNERGKKFNEAA